MESKAVATSAFMRRIRRVSRVERNCAGGETRTPTPEGTGT